MKLTRSIPLYLMLAAGCGAAQKSTKTNATTNATAAAPAAAAAPAKQAKDLIARELLFGNPERANVQISPDAKHLSWLAPVGGVLNVWVAPIDDLAKARAVTKDDNRGIRMYFWAYNAEQVLYIQDKGGDENWRVYATDVQDGATRDLTPFEKTAAQVLQVSPEHPDEILVALNNRNEQYHDIHRVNLQTGKLTLVEKNDQFAGYVADDDLVVRLAMKMTADGGSELFKPGKKKGSWDSFLEIGMEDMLGTNPVGFDKSGKVRSEGTRLNSSHTE